MGFIFLTVAIVNTHIFINFIFLITIAKPGCKCMGILYAIFLLLCLFKIFQNQKLHLVTASPYNLFRHMLLIKNLLPLLRSIALTAGHGSSHLQTQDGRQRREDQEPKLILSYTVGSVPAGALWDLISANWKINNNIKMIVLNLMIVTRPWKVRAVLS